MKVRPTRVQRVQPSVTPRPRDDRRLRALASVLCGLGLFLLTIAFTTSIGGAETTTTESSTTTADPSSSSSSSSSSSIDTSSSSSSTTSTSVTPTTVPAGDRPTPAPSSSISTTSSSTTSSTSTTVATQNAIAPPGFRSPGTGGGLSTGTQVVLVIAGLVAVAAGFIVLTVLYWRQTRPQPRRLPAIDLLSDHG